MKNKSKTTGRLSIQFETGLTKTGRIAHKSQSIPYFRPDAKKEEILALIELMRVIFIYPISAVYLIAETKTIVWTPEMREAQNENEEEILSATARQMQRTVQSAQSTTQTTTQTNTSANIATTSTPAALPEQVRQVEMIPAFADEGAVNFPRPAKPAVFGEAAADAPRPRPLNEELGSMFRIPGVEDFFKRPEMTAEIGYVSPIPKLEGMIYVDGP